MAKHRKTRVKEALNTLVDAGIREAYDKQRQDPELAVEYVKESILDAVYESMKRLYGIGLVDNKTMSDIIKICGYHTRDN